MKKHMRIITFSLLAILILTFSSCTAKDVEDTAGSIDDATADSTVEPFDMPPETNELVVYSNGMTRSVLNSAINFFKEQYPDVEVTFTNIPDDSYDDILKTELAAGKGPDIVYSINIDISDIYKLMLSNIFTNLDGFMNSDDSFNVDDYIPGVFNSGILKGKRYFVPIEFAAHVALTTQEILDEEGLTLDEIRTFNGYIDSIYNYNQKYSDSPDKSALYCPETLLPATFEVNKLLFYFGSTYVDYENNTVAVNDSKKDEFRTLMDGIRKIHGSPVVESFDYGSDYEGLLEHKCLYSDTFDMGSGLVQSYCRIIADAQNTPIVFAPQNPGGTVTGNVYSFAAIPEGAKNKLNAYRLLKIMLSDEFQGGEGDTRSSRIEYLTYCPVRNDAVYKHMTGYYVDDTNPELNNPAFVNVLEQCTEVMTSVEDAVLVPRQIWKYVREEMEPYYSGSKDWESCFNRLVGVLELYKDE